MTTVLWSLLFILLALVVLGAVLFIVPYNAFIRQRNVIEESWRQVDAELDRHHELAADLVETVRADGDHDRGALDRVAEVRAQALEASRPADGEAPTLERARVEQDLTAAVHQLVSSAQAHPGLRANPDFVELRRQLAQTEDRIAAGRRFYNANVRAYNTKVASAPSAMVARMFHLEKANCFEAGEPSENRAPGGTHGDRTPPEPPPGDPAR